MGKQWYESKVVWVNVVATVAAVVAILTEGSLLPPEAVPYVAAFVAILNVVLRVWFTDQPIA
jgi:hypothetical protein